MHFDSFAPFSFDQRIQAGIRDAGYEAPTPIQVQAIPHVLSGRDVLGLAQTGTGKTAAFALPILQRLLAADAGKRGPARVLVLAPTRELALQIQDTFIVLGRQTGIRSTVVIGGVGANPQIKGVAQSTIVVACPGRLLDLMQRGAADLSTVDTLVLDEADRMFDMGFLPDLKKILAKLPAKRQNLLFSATMPAEVRGLCDSVLQNPAVVQVANTAPAATISHTAYPVAAHLKPMFVDAFLRATEHDCVLIFTRTKHRARQLAKKLADKGFEAVALQGNLSQNRRQEALDGFRCGKYRIMVATDIAARGIDCERITHVVNFDLPDSAETYTHRVGRTGRAERSGEALTLLANDEVGGMHAIERQLGQSIPRKKLPGFDYDQPAPARTQSLDYREPRQGRGGNGNGRGRAAQPRQAEGRPAGKPERTAKPRRQEPAREERFERSARPERTERTERTGGRNGDARPAPKAAKPAKPAQPAAAPMGNRLTYAERAAANAAARQETKGGNRPGRAEGRKESIWGLRDSAKPAPKAQVAQAKPRRDEDDRADAPAGERKSRRRRRPRRQPEA